jgi:chromosome segregation ATPase
MDEIAGAQARERLNKWSAEIREMLEFLPQLFDASEKLSGKAEHAEKESERLRKELSDLRRELGEVRTEKETLQKQLDEAKKTDTRDKEIDELRKDIERLKGEKEEAVQAFAKLLETVQSTNVIAQKLGVTKSPFARKAEGNPAPHE